MSCIRVLDEVGIERSAGFRPDQRICPRAPSIEVRRILPATQSISS